MAKIFKIFDKDVNARSNFCRRGMRLDGGTVAVVKKVHDTASAKMDIGEGKFIVMGDITPFELVAKPNAEFL